MNPIKLYSENFEGKSKKVGEFVFVNETIPIFEFSVEIVEQKKEVVLNYDEFSNQYIEDSSWGRLYGKGKYEQEFLDMAKKLQDEIEKLDPVALAFIESDINRYSFYDVESSGRGSDNPVKGFIQAWTQYGRNWLTWVMTSVVTDKIANDEAFQTVFEKWSLAKFLQLVFGDDFLPAPFPRHGSETEKFDMSRFGNGCLDVGKLAVYHFWTKNGIESNLPDYENGYNGYLAFSDMMQLSEEELETLYDVLTRKRPPQDFYKKLLEEQ